jgi:hypothetical protein
MSNSGSPEGLADRTKATGLACPTLGVVELAKLTCADGAAPTPQPALRAVFWIHGFG